MSGGIDNVSRLLTSRGKFKVRKISVYRIKVFFYFKLVTSFAKRFSQVEIENGDEEQAKSSKKGRRKPAYAGGLVLEPKKGICCF